MTLAGTLTERKKKHHCFLFSFISQQILPLFPFQTGDDCSLSRSDLPSSIKDNFESGTVSQESWQTIQGGGVGSGCGQLSPHAHGDSLYFNGCKMRQAVTRPLDLTRARYRYYCNILCLRYAKDTRLARSSE